MWVHRHVRDKKQLSSVIAPTCAQLKTLRAQSWARLDPQAQSRLDRASLEHHLLTCFALCNLCISADINRGCVGWSMHKTEENRTSGRAALAKPKYVL